MWTDAFHRTVERLWIRVEPLVPTNDVRRRVRADAQAFVTQQRRDRARRRRLAVRAHDVDRREGALGMSELREERSHPVEAEFLRPRRKCLDKFSW